MMHAPLAAFSWRREFPVMMVPVLVAFGVRFLVGQYAQAYFNSDTAIMCLMARHIAIGERFPLLHYGQDYLGAGEAFFAAPWYYLYPDSPRVLAMGSAVLFSCAVLVYYRLFFIIGGRLGALAGTLTMGVGTTWLLYTTGGELIGYQGTMMLGALLLILAERFRAAPGGGRALAMGLVAGLGYWNHPNVAMFVACALVVLWAHGRTCTLREEGRLSAVWVYLGAALVVGFIGFHVWMCFHGPLKLGPLSLGKPQKYLPRAFLAVGGALMALEFCLALDRRGWIELLALALVGFAVGAAPLFVSKALHTGDYVLEAPTVLDASMAVEKWPELLYHANLILLDYSHPPGATYGGPLHWLLWVLRWIVGSIGLVGLLAAAWAHRRELLRLATFRPVALPMMVQQLLLGAGVVLLFLIHTGGAQVRYLLYLWVPVGGLIAWMVGQLATRRWAAGLLAGTLLLYYGLGTGLLIGAHLPAQRDHDHQLLASLEQRGLTGGYATYWWAYRNSYLSGERVRVTVFDRRMIGGHDPGLNRMPWYDQPIARLEDWFAIFNEQPPSLPTELAAERAFLARYGSRVVERWQVGPYRVYRLKGR